MNEKGQGSIIGMVLVLVVGVISLIIVQGVASPMYEAQDITGETGNFTNTGYTNLAESDLVTDSETVYNTTACSTELSDSEYTMNTTDGGIIMANTDYNTYEQCIDYEHYDDSYFEDSSLLRTILGNVPILFAIGLLVLAAMAVYQVRS